MNPEEQRANIVRYWWSKAEESLASAQREFAAGAYTFAVNRLYYAAFYGVCAALLERRQSFRKHSGVRALFTVSLSGPGYWTCSGENSTIASSRTARRGTT